jgi:microcystin-dependent protein
MSYTKNHNPWTALDALDISSMNNFESIYDQFYPTITTHSHTTLYSRTEMESTFWYTGNDGDGSGSDADLIYQSTGNLHAASFIGVGVPVGLIIMYADSPVPSGWQLCDGTNGTQNLLDRFVVGVGYDHDYGETKDGFNFVAAGSLTVYSHGLTIEEMPSHLHTWVDHYATTTSADTDYPAGYKQNTTTLSTTDTAGSSTGHAHIFSEGTVMEGIGVENLPFYYALYYIQKM